MSTKYILPIILLIILNGCAGIREHTQNVLLYQQKIVLNIISVLSFEDVDSNVEDTLYDYEENISEKCRALLEALIRKMNGKELPYELKTQIVNDLDSCEESIQEAELYLINENLIDGEQND